MRRLKGCLGPVRANTYCPHVFLPLRIDAGWPFVSVRTVTPLLLLGSLWALAGCERDSQATTAPAVAAAPVVAKASQRAADVPVYTYEVVNVMPHDSAAFTQGLVYSDGSLFESTGLNGQSSLRQVDLKTGKVLKRVEVGSEYFGEGLAVLGDRLFQLTWQNQKGFIYDRATFRREGEFAYAGEGWGLTTDGQLLILSDGTDRLRFIDPVTFAVKRTLDVVLGDHPAGRLNELEYVQGEIFANVWGENYVVRIDPATGRVAGIVDFAGLLPAEEQKPDTDVLNGIAYDAAGDRLFVTGKRWPKLYEVRLKRK